MSKESKCTNFNTLNVLNRDRIFLCGRSEAMALNKRSDRVPKNCNKYAKKKLKKKISNFGFSEI